MSADAKEMERVIISKVASATSTKTESVTVAQVLKNISDGCWREPIEEIRLAFRQGGKDAIGEMKKRLPGVMFSGRFGSRKAAALEQHSGLICADLDGLGTQLEQVRNKVIKDPHTLACFRSPSGDGLKVLVQIDPGRHIESFGALERYYKETLGLTIDASCKDVSRLCFVSYDPDLFENANAVRLEVAVAEPAATVTPAAIVGAAENVPDIPPHVRGAEAGIDEEPKIQAALAQIPASCDYNDWVRIGMALQAWDARRGFHLWDEWSKTHPTKYKAAEMASKWASFQTERKDGVTLGTLFAMAKRYAGGQAGAATPAAETIPDAVDVGNWIDKDPPAVDAIIEEVFDAGDKVPIIGSSKARKSFFVLQMVLTMAAGFDRFLLWNIPKARRVLLIQLEVKQAHYHRRVHRMARKLGISSSKLGGRLKAVSLRGIKVTLPMLERLAQAHKAELVIIDPLYKILTGDENSAEDMKPTLEMFDRLTEATGAAVVYVHHNPKGKAGDRDARDRGAGTGILARDFDACIYLTDHREDNHLVVETLLRNYPPRSAFTIAWEDGKFTDKGDMAPVVRTSSNAKKDGMCNAGLTDEVALSAVTTKPLTSAELGEKLKVMGFSRRGGEAAINRLSAAGKVVQWRTKTYPARIYYGTPDGIKEKKYELENPKLRSSG